jgi:hypothetical protein
MYIFDCIALKIYDVSFVIIMDWVYVLKCLYIIIDIL